MDQLADLVARITDIESCLVSAYKKEIDQTQITEMSEEMSKIENNLDRIEAEVRSQMLLVGQVDDMIFRVKNIRSCCNALPKIDDNDFEDEYIYPPIEKPLTSKIPIPTENKVKSEQHLKKEAAKPKKEKQESEGVPSRDTYLIHIDESTKFVKKGGFRFKTSDLNICIDEINNILAQKYRILNAPKRELKGKTGDLWKRYKDEGDYPSPFFTDTDIQDMPMIKKNRNILNTLKAMGLIYDDNNKRTRMYIIKGYE